MNAALSFHIKLQRKDFALDVKADIPNGITGIFGPSGHGKTSLLNSIAGIVTPDSGYIRLNGDTLLDSNKKVNVKIRQRRVGYVFQDERLFPHYTIRKNLLYGEKNPDPELFDEVIDTLQIAHLLNKKPEQCSGGEKQRAAIGRAIISGSKILLMDEPFSALDVNLRREIIPYLNRVHQKFSLPILIVSHDLPDLLSLTDNLLLLKNGQLQGHGKFTDLLDQPENLELMHQSGWYNVLHLSVLEYLESKNMVLLKSHKSNLQIQALTQTIGKDVEVNQELKVLIKPESIALSKEPVQNISLRNQVAGTMKEVFLKDGLAFCVVDVGENIIVEVTEASQKSLCLEKGQRVYCLFKSAALKIY
ncbi:molybdate transport system ATP-binding protein [Draconibacterium orientale]|uniref:Molybdate transport system ATP-binding protein n=1 Tax=Draconibacterium orientale TaxID=1168034 RepID=X5DXR0_9BACT|nr:molybdenum ABC transporter ATP-binding protein [Draconibacterium orientale]AHW60015.1 molybdenum ABC transporter ATP-binding protein [Draconibacterium orientale]SEU09855.1 molybdate transport system ATP-binding protein [Draconibacterium orientale]